MVEGFQGAEGRGQIYGQRLAEMAKIHSSEAFYALDDPLEAAVFSVLIELMKELERGELAKKRRSHDLRGSVCW